MAGTEASPVSTSGADSVARVGGGVGECLGGVIMALSGECGPEVVSARGRVIEECVRLIAIGALHKKGTEMIFG